MDKQTLRGQLPEVTEHLGNIMAEERERKKQNKKNEH